MNSDVLTALKNELKHGLITDLMDMYNHAIYLQKNAVSLGISNTSIDQEEIVTKDSFMRKWRTKLSQFKSSIGMPEFEKFIQEMYGALHLFNFDIDTVYLSYGGVMLVNHRDLLKPNSYGWYEDAFDLSAESSYNGESQ
jgi:hypothetical protein